MLIGVDPKCVELADHFLQDESNVTEEDGDDLAMAIQTAVEDWFFLREHKTQEG